MKSLYLGFSSFLIGVSSITGSFEIIGLIVSLFWGGDDVLTFRCVFVSENAIILIIANKIKNTIV